MFSDQEQAHLVAMQQMTTHLVNKNLFHFNQSQKSVNTNKQYLRTLTAFENYLQDILQ